ncbi:hypothetical protein [Geminocystis herdmanii]|uniref:hypothetical protein n=1 Tax=Geminocystis herdmanii TaxID=669359 RepID=UPI000344F177|nr:hypothetical protein [Geminocystis herdmanii]
MNKLFQAQTQAEALLLKASLNPSLDTTLTTAFGNNYNVTVANNIFSSWRNRDFSNLPTIEILSPTAMNGAQGAYSALNNTIYLSSSLIESQSSKQIRNVLLEEYGHFIDAQINNQDSQGDEGEIWRNLVFNRKMSTAQLDTLRSENDWGTITVDGETLNVENSIITLTVNTFFDENDGSASTGAGLSLRDAIIIANNDTNNDYIINLASGQSYFLTVGSSSEDILRKGIT